MTEAELQAEVIRLCDQLGLLWHHCRDSRTCQGEKGIPDLVIIGRHALFRELKSEDGRRSQNQVLYGKLLLAAGLNYDVWRPADLETGRIEHELLMASA